MSRESDAHAAFEELAVRHVLGGLAEQEAQVFRAHLLECGECRARVGELRAIASDLADVERDERRQRAAKALETKRRERDRDEEGGDDRGPGSPRSLRLLFFGGIGIMILLAIWNFTLRSNNIELRERLQAEQEASSVINFGTPWLTEVSPGPVVGVARESDGRLAVFVDGLAANQVYGVYILAEDDRVLNWLAVPAVDGRVRYLHDREDAAVRIEVWRPPSGTPGENPAGRQVFGASAPGIDDNREQTSEETEAS